MAIFRSLFLLFVLYQAAVVSARGSKSVSKWQTLSGNAPSVVARGGFSGIFPDSSIDAYNMVQSLSVSNVFFWCDVQLTKDAAGICFPSLTLDNASNIAQLYQKEQVHLVNGVAQQGWFSVDYTLEQLYNVTLQQAIYSRTQRYDGLYNILTVEDVYAQTTVPGMWLNIQHDAFFKQYNLSMRSYVLSISKIHSVDYVSSPEVGFLSSLASRLKGTKTQLIFRFLGTNDVDPSINQTYGSLLSNLTFIKTFASGILVPKTYIWPVDAGLYLQSHTSLVLDAHSLGLEVFASDFANDAVLSYNYSYDPVAEYLSFVDNGDFSVDGVLSDFPVTPSEAIGCFSHVSKNGTGQAPPVVITHDGASGIYPGCTDVAYQQAIDDGADFIDCSVQMTSDGIPICLGSINLMNSTTVAQTLYSTRAAIIPEFQSTAGVYTFNLTWKEIQSLKPAISNPFSGYSLYRYPAHKNSGSLVSLDNFLSFAKTKALSGVLLSVENAAYLAEYRGLDIIGSVIDSLNKSGYNNQTLQKVMIQSTNSSVLKEFKKKTSYELVYQVDENIRGALNSSIKDIQGFAHSVSVTKETIFPVNKQFLTGATPDVVDKLHAYNLTVYAYLFTNEFVSQAWDFFGDSTAEINNFVNAGIDGLVTEFPATAIAYRKNKCLSMKNPPNYMLSVPPGGLIQVVNPILLPPAEAPNPVLTDSDVVEPPLPPVALEKTIAETPGPAAAPTASTKSGQPQGVSCHFLSSLLFVLLAFFF